METPASKPKSESSRQPAVFEWYENRIEESLQGVYQHDRADRQKIVEVIEELNDSNMFWKLMAAYTNEAEAAENDPVRQNDALMAILARLYIAGTMRGAAVIEL